MRARDAINVFITTGETTYDFTDGILNIDIVRGVDEYQSIAQVPDVGQLTLVSRNELLDPNVTSAVRFNSKIEVYAKKEELGESVLIYRGFITDINVEYRPKNQPPLITINAIDQIGILQRHKFTSSFRSYLISTYGLDGVSLTELFTALTTGYFAATGKIEIQNFSGTTSLMENHSPGTLIEGKAALKSGDIAYDFIVDLMQTNVSQMHIRPDGSIYVYPYFKHDPDYFYYPTGYPEGPSVEFKSDGTGYSYETILIDDGFDRTINQVLIRNLDREYLFDPYSGQYDNVDSETTWGVYNSTASIDEWNTSGLELRTLINNNTDKVEATFSRLASNILQIDGDSTIEAKIISWDALGSNSPDPLIDPMFKYNVHVYHEVTDLITIDKWYEVCGIRHSINEGNWTITYILKKNKFDIMRQFIPNYSPTINLSPLTGNTNTVFTASVAGYPSGEQEKVRWQLASTLGSEYFPPYVFDVPSHSNPANGRVVSWNYDPGTGKTYAGAGIKKIRAWIENAAGWTLFANKTIEVTAAQPVANFSYLIDDVGGVQFTDLSYDADTWYWEFGDSTTSTLQNPYKVFATSGTKSVKLTISNGVLTDDITKTLTINAIPVNVKWVKAVFKGTQTRANSSSPWNKELPLQVTDFFLDGDYYADIWHATASPKPIVGTVMASDAFATPQEYTPWTGLAPIPPGWTTSYGSEPWLWLITSQYNTDSFMQITPLITNSGNTREIDIEVYIMLPNASTGIDGVRSMFTVSKNYGGQDVFYELGKTYEQIKIYFSGNPTTSMTTIKSDTTSWTQVGYIQPTDITQTQIDQNYFYRAMTAIVPLPLKKTS